MKKGFNSSTFILIAGIFAAILAGVLVFLGQQYFNKTVPVYYAGEKDIQPNTIIKEINVKEGKMPEAVVRNQNLATRKEEVVGKVTNSIIKANSPIFKHQVQSLQGNSNVLAAKLTRMEDPDIVAFTVSTNQVQAIGGKIEQNDMVHVIGALEVPKESEGKEQIVKVLVPYAKVLDVVKSDSEIKGVTLALTVQQVLDVQYAMKKGNVSLALLPYNHNKDVDNKTMVDDSSFNKKHLAETEAGEAE